MKISELIAELETLRSREGDLEVIHRRGEMCDPEPVEQVLAVAALVRGSANSLWYSIPYPGEKGLITNTRIAELV